ncbi:MAG TPA: hypothetical protein DIW81_27295 [Planctomycetaceae bacterium]|nr:hypothetical protein [Rubinisphaera sp.]HCS55248.1 hypothetical protein [Planctomycetaceae bacterium]
MIPDDNLFVIHQQIGIVPGADFHSRINVENISVNLFIPTLHLYSETCFVFLVKKFKKRWTARQTWVHKYTYTWQNYPAESNGVSFGRSETVTVNICSFLRNQ